MSLITDFIYKIYNRLLGKEEPVEQNDDIAVIPSTSVKRLPEENTYEEDMSSKRKKTLSSIPSKNDIDPCFTSYLSRSSLSEFQKENQQMASDKLRVNEILRRSKSSRIKRQEVYCIDDNDFEAQSQRNGTPPLRTMSLRSGNRSNSLMKSSSSDDCMIVSETSATSSMNTSFSKLCFPKVHLIKDRSTFLTMLKNECTNQRNPKKSTPLTNSTIHNTKLNKKSPNDFFRTRICTRSQSLNPYSPCSLSIKSDSSVNLAESAFDKVVIDLTRSEDDEDQRQAIESKVLSSSEIKNMKSSFVAEDTFALDEDLLSSLTKKYDTRLQKMKLRASKLEKTVADHRDEIAKTIAEILEKRLTLKEHVEETEDVSQKSSMELVPVTKEMIAEINGILATKKIPLVQIKDTSIKVQDIRTLEHTAWLNDEVVNAYMNLIKLRSEENPDKYPKVHCFNTFLYEQLNKKGYMSVRRWTRKVDIFSYDILIIPIHLGNHWCLTQINFQEKSILYYDSMGSPNNRCLNTVMQYLIEEYEDKKKGSFDTSDWKLINVPHEEIPRQKNAYDCGVFACTFAEHITRNSPFIFDQDHMSYFRVKMMYEILKGKLLL